MQQPEVQERGVSAQARHPWYRARSESTLRAIGGTAGLVSDFFTAFPAGASEWPIQRRNFLQFPWAPSFVRS
jgi:hypothetical protein